MSDRTHKHGTGACGFSLLETLVALAILSVSLGAVLSLFASALRAAAQADAITRATRAGESLLARLGTEIPLQEGVSHGDLDARYHWRITVRPYPPEDGLQHWQTPLHAYWIDVEVRWDAAIPHSAVQLSTLRLTTERGTAL